MNAFVAINTSVIETIPVISKCLGVFSEKVKGSVPVHTSCDNREPAVKNDL